MKPKLSIAVATHKKLQNTQVFYESVNRVLDGVFNLGLLEVITIKDRTKNDTLNHLTQINLQGNRFKVVELSRNFIEEASLPISVEFTSGGAIIPINADLKDLSEVILKLVKICKEGFDFFTTFSEERAGKAGVEKGMICD